MHTFIVENTTFFGLRIANIVIFFQLQSNNWCTCVIFTIIYQHSICMCQQICTTNTKPFFKPDLVFDVLNFSYPCHYRYSFDKCRRFSCDIIRFLLRLLSHIRFAIMFFIGQGFLEASGVPSCQYRQFKRTLQFLYKRVG